MFGDSLSKPLFCAGVASVCASSRKFADCGNICASYSVESIGEFPWFDDANALSAGQDFGRVGEPSGGFGRRHIGLGPIDPEVPPTIALGYAGLVSLGCQHRIEQASGTDGAE